jgi:hypothetical protein
MSDRLLPPHLRPLLLWCALILVLPLLGATLGGLPVGELLTLPRVQQAWDPLPPDALFTGVLNALALLLLILPLWLGRPITTRGRRMPNAKARAVPRFAWFGVFALLLAVMAAEGGGVNAAVGLVTLALAILVNADTERRTGTCLLSQRPGYFLRLFGASLIAGWLFHWLNLFLGLWRYPNAMETLPFVIGKSLDYAVLLPALLSLRQWLASFPWLLDATTRATPIAAASTPREGWVVAAIALLALTGAALWPDWIYPATLTAPLLLALALNQIRGRPTPLVGVASGDWSRVLLPALAAVLLTALAQGLNGLIGPGWIIDPSQLGGPAPLGLPLPAWAWVGLLGPLGIWLGDGLTEPFKQNPQQPPMRTRFPVRVEIGGNAN